MKKPISFILIQCMVLAMMPMTAFAVEDPPPPSPPAITSIVASNDADGEGDKVTITFDQNTNHPTIYAATIDAFLSLNNGHSWGSLSDGDIAWNADGNRLTIIFSNVANSTIAEGDTISFGNANIKNSAGTSAASTAAGTIIGSFSPRIFSEALYAGGPLCTFKVLTVPKSGTRGTVQLGDGTTAAISTTEAGDITIPAQISYESITYNVTEIGDNAFLNCSNLTGLAYDPALDLKAIGDYAFSDCSSLTGPLTIPSSVTTIGNYAFYNCDDLTGVTIQEGVREIGDYAFSSCDGLTGPLIIPSSVTTIGERAFNNCTGLNDALIIREGVETIGNYAFYDCRSLEGVTIPSSVTTIGNGAFCNCLSLTGELTIPASVTTIGTQAFQSCRNLTGTLTIQSAVTTIQGEAFKGCDSLTALELQGNSLPTMGTGSFNGCTDLVKLFVPAAWTDSDTVTLSGIGTDFNIEDASLVKVAGLTSVLGEALSVPGGGTGAAIETPINWSINVASTVTEVSSGAIAPAESSTAVLYSNSGFTANENEPIPLSPGGETIAYIKVTSTAISSDPVTTRYHKVTIHRAAAPISDISAASATITAPARGAAPQSTAAAEAATANADYTVTGLTWNEQLSGDSKFKASQVYTATVTLTSKNGKKFQAGAFTPTVAGAASVGTTTTSGGDVSGNTVSFTVTYAATAAAPSGNSNGSGGGGGGGSAAPPVTKIESGDTVAGTNVDKLVKEGKALTVEGKTGEKLVLDTEALKTIDGQTKDSVKVEIKDVSADYKNQHPDRLVVSLSVTAGGKHITSFGNGTATVSLPYELKAGEKAADVTVWYLAEDGTMTEVPCTYDATTKLATFKVNHFSLYVVGTADTTKWTNPFSDVKESSWFYDAVRYVSANEMMQGTDDKSFNPNGKTTRGMIVTILWRMENQPKATKDITFADVKDGKYYHDAVAWASEKGIVGGYSAEKFGPEDNITREQLAVILHNYAKSKGYMTDAAADLSAFGDAGKAHSWSKDSLSWANGKGLITGTGSNLLDPLGAAERCQVAAILQRFVENTVK